jgi:hypothetical protein
MKKNLLIQSLILLFCLQILAMPALAMDNKASIAGMVDDIAGK